MKNLIPQFISQKYIAKKMQGQFKATTLFMDISGFTPLTEALMKHGKEGAEVLSTIINDIFNPIINAVYERGGFISGFAGDAFTAIFPDSEPPLQALHSASEICKFFQDKGLCRTPLGDFELQVKIGLSFGEVDWGIVGNDKYKSYYFKGSAIDDCANSEHHCNKMDIILDQAIIDILPKESISFQPIIQGFYKLNSINTILDKPNIIPPKEITEDIISHFLPKKVIEFSGIGELRDSVNVFISFRDTITHDAINKLMTDVLTEGNKLGAYVKGMDFGDKGGTILVIFGAPVSYENNLERSLDFILAIKEKYKSQIRAGISSGILFAGLVGSSRRSAYDVLGDTVNTSARFMMKAEWGKVFLAKKLSVKSEHKFNTIPVGELSLKGKSKPISVFELIDKKKVILDNFYRGEMVGRTNEIAFLNEKLKLINDGKFAGLIYVYGEAGIGKSRFVYEVTKSYEESSKLCLLQCDSILKKSLNPFVYFLNYFFKTNTNDENKENNFNNSFNELLDNLEKLTDARTQEIIKELKRTESLLRALLDLNTSGMLYEKLDPKLRFENTVMAIKTLFRGLSLLQPTIIQLEDIHWIDEDSKTLMQSLMRNVEDYPFVVIATSRYQDDGSKPILDLADEINPSTIELQELGSDFAKDLVKTWLGHSADEALFSFIAKRTQNNPFYIEQFCLYLLENKFITLENNIYQLADATKGIPNGINAILIARIDRLSSELKELVQVASVLGREFDVSIITEMLEILENLITISQSVHKDDNKRATVLDRKRMANLLFDGSKESLWNQFKEMKYIFKHALLVESAYEMQLKKRLKEIHKIAGEVIEKMYRDNPSMYLDIAYHYEKAEIKDKTKEYLEKAGSYLKESYRNEEALEVYDKLLSMNLDEEKYLDIVDNKSEILKLVGRWDDTISLIEDNMELAEKIGGKLLFRLKISLGNILKNKGEYDKAMMLYEETKRMAEKLGDMRIYAPIFINMGIVYGSKGDYDKAMSCFEECKSIYLKLGDKGGYSHALVNIGIVYASKGEFDKSMSCLEERKNICLELGDRIGYSIALGNIGIIHYNNGDYDKAMNYFEEWKSICLEHGNKSGYSSAIGNIGNIYHNKGDYDKAMVCHEEDKNICLELGDKSGYATAVDSIGLIYYEKGDFENAMKCYDEAIEIGRELGIKYYLCGYLNNKARLLFNLGKTLEAKSFNDESIEMAKSFRKDLFEFTILHHRINAVLVNKEEGISGLLSMLKDYSDDEHVARIYYELWKITKDLTHKEIALDKYQSLYEETKLHEYKKYIDQMLS